MIADTVPTCDQLPRRWDWIDQMILIIGAIAPERGYLLW